MLISSGVLFECNYILDILVLGIGFALVFTVLATKAAKDVASLIATANLGEVTR